MKALRVISPANFTVIEEGGVKKLKFDYDIDTNAYEVKIVVLTNPNHYFHIEDNSNVIITGRETDNNNSTRVSGSQISNGSKIIAKDTDYTSIRAWAYGNLKESYLNDATKSRRVTSGDVKDSDVHYRLERDIDFRIVSVLITDTPPNHTAHISLDGVESDLTVGTWFPIPDDTVSASIYHKRGTEKLTAIGLDL